jgi:hypothetical protein
MSRFQVKTIGVVLFLIGLLSVTYKTQVLDIPIMPKANYDSWSVDYVVNLSRDRDQVNLKVPNIISRELQTVESKGVTKKEVVLKGDLKKGEVFKQTYSINFHKKKRHIDVNLKSLFKYKQEEKDTKALKKIFDRFSSSNKTNLEFGKNLAHYIHSEISMVNTNVGDITKAIVTETASYDEKALIYHYLMLMKGVPSRVLVGVNLNTKELQKITTSVESSFSLVNQVFVDTKWHTIGFDTEDGKYDMSRFIVISDNYLRYKDLFEHQSLNMKFLVTPGTVSGVDGVSYNKLLRQKSSFFSSFNLFSFPSELQRFYFYILIIPFGTLILAFCRNIVGIKTFGIFMPILLGLFLASSSFWFGLLTLFLVVLLGLVERYVLDKFYLLAVPRLSIILTLIVCLFLGMGVMNVNFGMFTTQMFSGVPIVILAVFVETLSVQLLEEGIVKSAPPILGTLFIAILSWALYQFLFVRVILFSHPELLISIIGLLVLIGSYHGYRISELLRFKSFIEEQKNV